MFLEHPIGTLFTDLLTADEISQPEVAYWHEAQEEMEKRAFSGSAFRRICAQIKTVQKKQLYLEVVSNLPVIDQEIIDRVMESDGAISAIGLHGMSHEILDGVRRVVVNQGLVEDFSPVVQSSFDNDLYDKVASRPSHLGAFPILPKGTTSRAELDAIFDQADELLKMDEDVTAGRPLKIPSYIGGRPTALKGQISREELNAILDAPDVSILDEIEEENKKVVRQDSPSLKTHSAVKDVDEEPDKKRKKQKFVQKGRDYGHGGRSDRKRGRNGPTGFH